MKFLQFKKKITIIFTILLIFGNVYYDAWSRSETSNYIGSQSLLSGSDNNEDKIVLLFNEADIDMSLTMNNVYDILAQVFPNIEKIQVSYPWEIEDVLDQNPWIVIYCFNASTSGLDIAGRSFSWDNFCNIIQQYDQTHHILGMSNTLSMESLLHEYDTNIYSSETEQTDAMLLMMFDLWAVSEIFSARAEEEEYYQDLAEDFSKMVIKIYADNFNTLFQMQIEPVNVVGEVDAVAREERTSKMWDEHAPVIEQTGYKINDTGNLVELSAEEMAGEFNPLVTLSGAGDSGSDFLLGELPLFSGLNGPIGDIVNTLLDVLASTGGSSLGISNDVMESIQTSITQLQSVIGLVDDFNSESALKIVIEAISNEFPFVEDMKGYINIFVKALFNLRGDTDSIMEIVLELVDELIADLLPESARDCIEEVLDIGDDLLDIINDVKNEGKSVFDAIASFFSENVSNKLLNKTLVATLNISQSDVNDILTKADVLLSSTISFLVSFDIKEFASTVGAELLEALLGELDPEIQDMVDKFESLIELAMGVADLINDFDADSVMSLVTEACKTFIGENNFTDDAETAAREIMAIVKSYKEGALSSVENFKAEVLSKLNEQINAAVPLETRELIAEIMAMVTGIFNNGFSTNDLPDLFEIAEDIVEQFVPASNITAVKNAINNAIKPIMGMVSYITDSGSLKQLISKSLGDYNSVYEAIPDLLKTTMNYFYDNASEVADFNSTIDTYGQIAGSIMNMISEVRGQSFSGILKSVWMTVGSIVGIHPSFDDVPIDAFMKLAQSFFPETFGLTQDELPNKTELINEIMGYIGTLLTGDISKNDIESFLNIAMDLRGLFTDGLDWVVGKIMDWLQGMITPMIDDMEKSINDAIGGDNSLLGYKGTIPIGLGAWSLFDLDVNLAITANFSIDPSPLFNLVKSLILDGRSTLSLNSLDDFFDIIFSFFEISPQFYAELGVKGLDSSKNSFMKYLMESMGVGISFSGSAKFVISLFTFRNGMFEWEDFFNVLEWGFQIKVQIQKTYTVLDFFTAGVGGGVFSSISKYIGLDGITITVFLSMSIDITKKAATAEEPEISTLTLTLSIGATMHVGIDLTVAEIAFDGTLEISLTFFFDMGSNAPMKITLRLVMTLKVKFKFAWSDKTKTWDWEPGGPWDLSPNKGEAEYEESGVGLDADGDGLGDDYEAQIPGLDPNDPDTDDDGASDKLEVQTMGTDPVIADCDNDGLLDGEEWELGTNPMQPDTDWDKVGDYEEVYVYLTDPLSQDTDGDSLTDGYEINTILDISNVTTTVSEVIIGGESYNDRTDPLNPDTDGDGLVDGDEGPMGAYYGLDSLYDESSSDEDPLIFNYGYTHPLDADTDDDSYLQLYNGVVDSQASNNYLMDMNDGAEVRGFTIITYDEEGEPEEKQIYTNPVNPDTDGDTGITDRTPQPGAWINSDGYELAQNPPTDPTDGDSDDDGLIDGIEGVLNPLSNHTNPNDADTDDDGLFDMQEILLGSDPRAADTDFDTIPDGDEFYVYNTNPNYDDSDFDGLDDGEEVYLWHSNPLSDDSDGDGILDGDEVLLYGSDPMDDDSDNDGLSDFEEILIYYTDPFTYDSDEDGLSDGDEINTWDTDPLNWDTDGDSILDLNENDEITWSMNDYDEVMIYNTNPTSPDTDLDGLSDSVELYFASGLIPWLDSLPISPLDNDTDDDGFLDGQEVQLQNTSAIIYPYVALTLIYPYNTSPVMADTDLDNISDYLELTVYNSNPQLQDTDNDTLTDWEEIDVYGTSPIYNDTDGDGLLDNEEIGGTYSGSTAAGNSFQPEAAAEYNTDPLNADSDGDGLPDGAEVLFYYSNPLAENAEDEFDTDYDGLPDSLEFELELEFVLDGGITNPDTDGDGLLDGDEYYLHGTAADNDDTDGDGYSDGTEVSIGTDPLTVTSAAEYDARMMYFRGTTSLSVLTPKITDIVYEDTALSILNYTSFSTMSYYYSNGVGWSENHSLVYDDSVQQWKDSDASWPEGTYTLFIEAEDYDGLQYVVEVQFTSQSQPNYEPDGPNWGLIIGLIALAVALAVAGFFLWTIFDPNAQQRIIELQNKIRQKKRDDLPEISTPNSKSNVENSVESISKKEHPSYVGENPVSSPNQKTVEKNSNNIDKNPVEKTSKPNANSTKSTTTKTSNTATKKTAVKKATVKKTAVKGSFTKSTTTKNISGKKSAGKKTTKKSTNSKKTTSKKTTKKKPTKKKTSRKKTTKKSTGTKKNNQDKKEVGK